MSLYFGTPVTPTWKTKTEDKNAKADLAVPKATSHVMGLEALADFLGEALLALQSLWRFLFSKRFFV